MTAQEKTEWPISADAWEACTHEVDGMAVIGVNAAGNKSKVLAVTGRQGALDEAESIGNAFLIAEAGSVYNECRIRPRELLERMRAAEARLASLNVPAVLIAGAGLQGVGTHLAAGVPGNGPVGGAVEGML